MTKTNRHTNRVPPNSKLVNETPIYMNVTDSFAADRMRAASKNMLRAIVKTGKLFGPMSEEDKIALIRYVNAPDEKRKSAKI